MSEGELKTAKTQLKWIGTPSLGQGRSSGGNAASEIFEAGGSQRKRSLLETLVREICQNSLDQRKDKKVKIFFDLIVLKGEKKEKFLKSINSETLIPHLSSVKGSSGTALTLKAGLESMKSSDLVCLKISDYGTDGLTGDDWDEKGNFRKLCVQNFSTGKESGLGGSFGLGKAVSWMHSRIFTVLFSSRIEGRKKLRIFGRSEIPAHEMDGKSWLDGAYMGSESEKDGIPIAESTWMKERDAEKILLNRDNETECGTTILIPTFHEPDRDDTGSSGIRDPEELCRDFTKAASKWFWPAISWERLDFKARVFREEGKSAEYISEARADEIWSPFVECGRVEPFEGAKSLFPGDSSSIDVEFPIPRRVEPSDNPELLHDELKSTVRLGVTRVSSKEECLPCRSTIALIRGSGMVIDYAEGTKLSDGGSYCAAAFVGTSLNEIAESDKTELSRENNAFAEEYFRAGEPVTHDDWLPTTRRLRESYTWRGHASRLRGIRYELRQILIQNLLTSFIAPPDEGPEMLKRMINLGRGIKEKKSLSKTKSSALEVVIDRDQCSFIKKANGWRIAGELVRSGESNRTAKVHLSFQSIADSGQGEMWGISDMRIMGSEQYISYDDSDSRRFVFSAENQFSSVPFECIVKPPSGVNPEIAGFRKVG